MAKRNLFQIDTRHFDLAAMMLKDIKRGAPRVMQNTINRTLTVAKKELNEGIKDEYTLKNATQINKAIEPVKARPGNLSGFLHLKGKNFSVTKFKFNPTSPMKRRKGRRSLKVVRTEIHRGKLEAWDYAFVAKLPNTTEVLTRTGKFDKKRHWKVKTKARKEVVKGKETTVSRYSTSLPQMAKYVLDKNPAIQKRVDDFFEDEFLKQIDTQLKKAKP